VFGNRVPRKIYGPEREETTGDWRRLHNKELHGLYSLPNIRVMELDRTCWKWHLLHMREKKMRMWFWWGEIKNRDHVEDTDVDGRIILK
jgi:hypothetical protein